MVMGREIDIEPRRVVDMVHSLDQAVLFEGPDRPIDSIQRDGPQMFPHRGVDILNRRVVHLLKKRFEYLGALVCDTQPLDFADRFEPLHHRCYRITILPGRHALCHLLGIILK